MFRVVSLALLLAMCAAICMVPAIADQSWGTRSGFSLDNNPTGHWSLGYIDDSAGFTLYNTRFEPGGGIVGWCGDHHPDRFGNVTINPTSQPVDAFGMRWEPGQVIVHPGMGLYRAVIRFVSPVSARIRLSIGFTGQAAGGNPASVAITVNGQGQFSGKMRGFVGRGASREARSGDHPEESFIRTITIARGDRIDFIVSGDGSDFPGPAGIDILASVTQLSGDVPPDDKPVFPDYGFRTFAGGGDDGWLGRILTLSQLPSGVGGTANAAQTGGKG